MSGKKVLQVLLSILCQEQNGNVDRGEYITSCVLKRGKAKITQEVVPTVHLYTSEQKYFGYTRK
jgi:hypothetical protein